MRRPPDILLLTAAIVSAFIAAVAWLLHGSHFHYAYTVAWIFAATSCWGLILRSRHGWSTAPALLFLAIPLAIFFPQMKFDLDVAEVLYLLAGSAIAGCAVALGAGKRSTALIAISFLAWVCGAFHLYWSRVDSPWWQTRTHTQWFWFALAIVIGRLLSPFALLASFRRHRWWRWALLVHFLDIEWLVLPEKHSARIPYGNLWIDISCVILITSLAYLSYRHLLHTLGIRMHPRPALTA